MQQNLKGLEEIN